MLTSVKREDNHPRGAYIHIMKLSRTRLVVLLLIIALAGLAVLQALFLRDAVALKEQAFSQNANAALGAAARKLESYEAATLVLRFNPQHPNGGKMTQHLPGPVQMRELLAAEREKPPSTQVTHDSLRSIVGTSRRIQLNVSDASHDSLLVDRPESSGDHHPPLKSGKGNRGMFMYRFSTDSNAVSWEVTQGDGKGTVVTRTAMDRQNKTWLVERVVDRLFFTEDLPIERRVDRHLLDSLVSESFREAGISLPYALGVTTADTLKIVTDSASTNAVKSSPYRARLFPLDMTGPQHELVAYFPGHTFYVLWQVAPMMIAAVVFMGLITACFTIALMIITRQKRFMARLADYVNNMVHEFKTPLSTVALATEAIQRKDIVGKKEKVLRYNRMIQEETTRMRRQADRILQMTVLERGEEVVAASPVDLHALLREASEKFALQVESRKGSLTARLEAQSWIVRGDAAHLLHIINNLIDNAIKYSPDAPSITVTTTNAVGTLVLQVRDQGIGIASEHRKKVFDKYFRVPTGNLHDVKGFGLGLSYVKLMTHAMGGSVGLETEPGRGTTVTVTLPLYLPENGGSA
jgi:two-component system, OmpR family, phosphate regulon sensor histidine kinase PhoR